MLYMYASIFSLFCEVNKTLASPYLGRLSKQDIIIKILAGSINLILGKIVDVCIYKSILSHSILRQM